MPWHLPYFAQLFWYCREQRRGNCDACIAYMLYFFRNAEGGRLCAAAVASIAALVKVSFGSKRSTRRGSCIGCITGQCTLSMILRGRRTCCGNYFTALLDFFVLSGLVPRACSILFCLYFRCSRRFFPCLRWSLGAWPTACGTSPCWSRGLITSPLRPTSPT